MSSMTGSRPNYSPVVENLPKNVAGYKQMVRFPTKSPETMDLWHQFMQAVAPQALQGVGTLGKIAGGDESMFQQLEAPAWNQYESAVGAVGTRYSNVGMGAQRSSGFKQQMGGMAGQFAQMLQSNRMSLQQQAIRDLVNMSSSLIQQDPYEQMLLQPQEKKSNWRNIVGAVLPIAATAAYAIPGVGPVAGPIATAAAAAASKSLVGND